VIWERAERPRARSRQAAAGVLTKETWGGEGHSGDGNWDWAMGRWASETYGAMGNGATNGVHTRLALLRAMGGVRAR